MSGPGGDVDFWELLEPMLAAGEVEEGTVMGSPCVRVGGEFVAMPNRREGGMVVKLPRQRVDELIEDGSGLPFAPAGKVFREWVHVPRFDEEVWLGLVGESRDFVTGS